MSWSIVSAKVASKTLGRTAYFVNALFETDWDVYAKPAFGGASAVLRYLGRYTHHVALSNHASPSTAST